MNLHVHIHLDPAIERMLDRGIQTLIKQGEKIMADLSKLQSEVNDISSTDDAVLALIDGLVAELKNAGSDQTAIDAVVSNLEAKRTQLAAAVVANTVPPAASTAATAGGAQS